MVEQQRELNREEQVLKERCKIEQRHLGQLTGYVDSVVGNLLTFDNRPEERVGRVKKNLDMSLNQLNVLLNIMHVTEESDPIYN